MDGDARGGGANGWVGEGREEEGQLYEQRWGRKRGEVGEIGEGEEGKGGVEGGVLSWEVISGGGRGGYGYEQR